MSEKTKKPNSYTSEFKESAVKLAIGSDQPIAATARDCSGLMKQDTLMRDNNYQSLRCKNEPKTQL